MTDAQCQPFVGAWCPLNACEAIACASDDDCLIAAGSVGDAAVPCAGGECADFARRSMSATRGGASPVLLPFIEGAAPRLHVLAASSSGLNPGDPGGLTFANLVPSTSGGAFGFDTFAASRQVRLPDDRHYRGGFAASLFDHPTLGRVEILFGVDRAGLVHLRWRRSE